MNEAMLVASLGRPRRTWTVGRGATGWVTSGRMSGRAWPPPAGAAAGGAAGGRVSGAAGWLSGAVATTNSGGVWRMILLKADCTWFQVSSKVPLLSMTTWAALSLAACGPWAVMRW